MNKRSTTSGVSILSFTTSELSDYPFGTKFVLSSLPFLQLRNKSSTRPSKCSSALVTRIPKVLSLLSSGTHPFRVLHLSDVSSSYSKILEDHAISLEYDPSLQRESILEYGVDGWRREQLNTYWEAALLRGGLLTRWILIVQMDH